MKKQYEPFIFYIFFYTASDILLFCLEEMFNAAEAMWFSPRGSYLAVASFNDTNVATATNPYYGQPFDVNNQYPEIVHFRYPKVN